MDAENWIDQYGNFLYNFAMIRLGNNTQLAEDFLQDTFLSALKTKSKYKGNSTERTWLKLMPRNRMLNYPG